ncbi:1,4-alpha-glucan branching protein GlgB [Lederbergia wuyishanensis]|uniref:1,4-alpha-glucan branching enzyme GlgB n=1 Tax=Lederbergia wuyishanensis TaxID=1347903 RepID=A0ABU0D010_9BACI|nr:1,4-alpha-glucan branching protein GlgB [Lederbergia wuyishanensis]MCJ8006346.1 1,4-alpha-glucan branching protein GlgB [Lederbergia wuyishanensis]MDQ0341715.1 1,4-alpha-glucan branching enzyme [Lederbergia wuyishanensis]
MYFNISEDDIFLFHQGTNYHSQDSLGCHKIQWEGKVGFRFAVWAPNAKNIYVVGDFNQWNGEYHPLKQITTEGLWVGFFTNIPIGIAYKYKIITSNGETLLKSDPYALQSELRPANASIVTRHSIYEWKDRDWQETKKEVHPFSSPISVYEVHLGSWKKKNNGQFYTYCELADELVPYVKTLGFTHIELLPLAEHPFDLSWGYQITGYFSVTSRYGTRDDFKYFIDVCHQNGLGVIIDWVPGHFCKDDFGLREFDGMPLYEYQDPCKAEKLSWGTLTFDFGRPEVQSFLISNALFWIEEYHVDGIRVDAVASMLYLNFDRYDQEKIYNSYGGEENLEAYAFIRKLNEVIFSFHPNVLMMAEDSSDLPLVTAPTYLGGLGFNYKWNMGWMNDMLEYMEKDPIYRKWHHHLLTFSFMYSHSENFLLPLSHDEVVHGKKSLLDKMPGDQWQQFANLRLLYGYMMGHPGKKLLFMGGELAQYSEWKDQEQLDWHLLEYPLHRGIFDYVKALNHFYIENPALYELDHEHSGFEWIDPHNIDQSTIVFRRCGRTPNEELIFVCNFTPNVSYDYKVGVPVPGVYREIFNSDRCEFGGSGQLNENPHISFPKKWHGLPQHIRIKIPPLAIAVFKREESITEEDGN